MANEPSLNEKIRRLTSVADDARAVLGPEIQATRHRFNIRARIGASLKNHLTSWIGGGVVAGLAGSLLFRRKTPKPEKVAKKGLLGILLGLLFTAVQPLLKVWLAGRFKDLIAAKFDPHEIPPRHPRPVRPFYQ